METLVFLEKGLVKAIKFNQSSNHFMNVDVTIIFIGRLLFWIINYFNCWVSHYLFPLQLFAWFKKDEGRVVLL